MAKRIYVVDDTDLVREFVIEAYEMSGYKTKEFSNADSLLEALANGEKPDLILMDTNMPGNLSGFEACERIKKNEPPNGIKIIGMSGRDYEDKWMEAGADAYFKKPFKSIIDLLNKTKELLGDKNEQRPINKARGI